MTILYKSNPTSVIEENAAFSFIEEQSDDWVVLDESPSAAESCDSEDAAAPTPHFRILGANDDDEPGRHHPILTPSLMDALRPFLPFALSEENFWLRYSSARDGSSLISFLNKVKGLQYTVIAVETVGGEVFGSFTGTAWRRERGFYGNGQAFLWRKRDSSQSMPRPSLDARSAQTNDESDVEVFKWSGANDLIQICTRDRIGVGGGGGGMTSDTSAAAGSSGFGFVIEDDLLRGSSSRCDTFGNPCLCPRSSDWGGVFEVARLEVYTLTPFMFVRDAERNEMMKMFVEENS